MGCDHCGAVNLRVPRGEGFICYECGQWNESTEDAERLDDEDEWPSDDL